MVLLFDEVEIANMALGHVGNTTRIQSFNQPNNTGARLSKQYFNIARADTLEHFNWGFAKRNVILALKATISEDQDLYVRYGAQWSHMFAWPDEALIIRKILSPSGRRDRKPVPYEIITADDDTKAILCNIGNQAVAEITVDVTDPSLWSASFVNTLSYRLAFYFAWPLTKKTSVQDRMNAKFDEQLKKASALDTHGQQDEQQPDADWTIDRN